MLAWPLGVKVREVALIVALYAATLAANGWGAALLVAAFTGLVVLRLTRGAVPGDWAFALAAALAGPAVEAALVAFGAFDYTEPDVLGLPIWLPLLWANGGLVVRRLFGLSIAQAHEPAERAHVGAPVRADAHGRVVVVEAETRAGELLYTVVPLRKSIAVKYHASVPSSRGGFVYV